MGLERQKGGFASRISYVLVVLASVLAFDFEPASGSERIAPSEIFSAEIELDASEPSSDDIQAVEPEVPRVSPAYGAPRLMRVRVADVSGPAQWFDHFDARGPPLRS